MTTSTPPSADATPSTDAEIDYAIGRRVMRWGVDRAHGQPAWNVPVDEKSGYVFLQSEWQPSVSIADAWRVLGQFPWPKFYVRLVVTETGNWRCDIELRGGDGPVISAVAKDAPLAICLAALAAVQP